MVHRQRYWPGAGYSLVELLVVLGLLGVLSSLVMPLATLTAQRQKEAELQRALWEIRDAIDAYHHAVAAGAAGAGRVVPGYPATLVELTLPLVDARPERRGQVLRFLRRVPRDPFADGQLAPEQTWGLRSYESEAARPRPGSDVYDVYSRSPLIGLNGVALAQW